MKKVLFIFLFFLGARLSACSCAFMPMKEAFLMSDMVARVKVIAEYPTNKQGIVKYKIKVLEQYKGKPSREIYYHTMKGTSCESYLSKNREMVIFARKNEEENYAMGPCSTKLFFSKEKEGKKEKQETIQKLHLLKKSL